MAVASLVAKVEAQVATFQKEFAEASRTAQKFEKDFATTASSVTAQQKRISDAFSTFSGDRLAREATAVAKSVEQIGGAAKLTASEQAKVNAVMTEAIAKYAALGQQAPKAVLDLEQATRKLESTTAGTQRTTSIFGQSLGGLEKGGTLTGRAMDVLTGTFGKFTLAGVAVGIINKVGGALAEMAATGVKLGPVQASFDRLAQGVGQNSQAMLGSLQTATRGLVSNYDLMLASNKALLLGLPVTSASMTELARTASVLGKAMGQDTTKSFDDLIVALGRSSPLILDNLGLTVKVEEANQKYAASLGKTADDLTGAEKKMAFYTEAMNKARERTRQIGEQTLTLGEIVSSVWTRVGNIVSGTVSTINVETGKMITESATALTSIAGFVNSLRTNGIRGAAALALVNDQMAQVVRAANTVAVPQIVPEDLPAKVKRLQGEIALLTVVQKQNIAAGKLLGQNNKEITEGMSALSGKVKVTTAHLDLMDEIERRNAATKREGTKATKSLEHEADEMVKRITKETEGRHDLQVWMGRNQASLLKFTTEKAREQFEILTREMDAATQAQLMFQTATGFSRTGLPQISDANGPQRIDLGSPRFDIKIPKSFWEKAFGTSTKDIGAALGNAIGGAIQGGGDVFASAAGGIGQTLATGLATKLTSFRKDPDGNPIAPMLSGWIGGAVSAVLPGVGALLGPLVGKIKEAFGGPSKSELAGRDVVSSFEQTLANSLTAAQKLSTGNVSWKNTTVAVSNAYLAAGRTAAEAEAAVSKLWSSSKGGADRARLAVLEIQAVMDGVTSKTGALAPTFGDVSAAAQALGIDVNKIGDSINQLRVTDSAKALVGQFDLLRLAGADMDQVADQIAKHAAAAATLQTELNTAKNSGADMAKVMEDLGKKAKDSGLDIEHLGDTTLSQLQRMVDESLKWGHALPESLRPILSKMTDMGLLTDATGDKLGDLNGIHWDKPLGDAIDGLKDSMRELAQVIRDDVGGALRGLPDVNGIRARGDVSLDVPRLASGGIVRKPTLALVGEAGPEAVIPLSSGSAPAVDGGGGDVFLDGEKVGEILDRRQNRLLRQRVKVGAR